MFQSTILAILLATAPQAGDRVSAPSGNAESQGEARGAISGAPDSALEQTRRSHDPAQIRALVADLQKRAAENPNDGKTYYQMALAHSYLGDIAESQKDKKTLSHEIDEAITNVQHSLQLDEKSADAHSLLADLYARKIPLGIGMFTGPKFGPKVKEENQRALALDPNSARVWASLGRQYLMAPKMFGGDIARAQESFQKSLALDGNQDDTWVWLARTYQKQGDKAKAHEALERALQLNPASLLAKETAADLR